MDWQRIKDCGRRRGGRRVGWGRGRRTTFLRLSDAMFVQHFYPFQASSVTVHETEHLHLSVSVDKLALYARSSHIHPYSQAKRMSTCETNSQNLHWIVSVPLRCKNPISVVKKTPKIVSLKLRTNQHFLY